MPASKVSLKDLVDAGFLSPGQELECRPRGGASYAGRLNADGTIRYKRLIFVHPSQWANHVTGAYTRNGWREVYAKGDSIGFFREKLVAQTIGRPTERYVTSGTARLWSTVSGQGTPLVMFNGGPGADDYLGPVADMVDDLCRVVRFEPRGCGRSDWDGNYDIDTLLTDADVVRREYGMEKCIVAGHSFGPSAALAYALRYPSHVMGLIGIAGGYMLNDRTWSEAYHKGLEEVGEDRGGHEDNADPKVNPDSNRSWREYIKRPAMFREIADLDIPAIFINGEKDIRPNWPTRQLASLMPRGRYVEIHDAAHGVWLTHATELKHELRRAVRQIVEST
jgi:proline iminopeptidase